MGNGVSGRVTVSLYLDLASAPDIRSRTRALPSGPAGRVGAMADDVRLERASWADYFMSIAQVVATRSTCPRKYVGSVMVRNRIILSTGYNGSIRGMPHCSDVGHMME